jgi:hypothetical protein
VYIGSGWEVCGWRYGHGFGSVDRNLNAKARPGLRPNASNKAQVIVRSMPSLKRLIYSVDSMLNVLAELESEGERSLIDKRYQRER